MAVAIRRATQPKRHYVSLEEFDRMIEAGVFKDNARLELIRGEILEMPPPGFEHQYAVALLIKLLERRAGDFVLVWPQGNSIDLPESDSRPQPDVTLLRLRDNYSRTRPPTGEDVMLAIEVSDTSLKYDRTDKQKLYAESGIPEYWIVDLKRHVIEVYSNLVDAEYKDIRRAGKGDVLPVPGAPEVTIGVDEILV
jgi:Uma2 family endonuclease